MARPYRIVVFAALVVCGVVLVVLLAKPILVLFAGCLFALVLRSLSGAVARVSKLPYAVCLAVVLVALLALVVGFVVRFGPAVREQASEIATRLPGAARELGERIHLVPITKALAPEGAAAAVPSQMRALASGAATAVGAALEVVGGLVVVFFVGLYGAARPDVYARALLTVAPAEHRGRVERVLGELSTSLSRWLLGRLVAMLFVGITCAVAFAILGVPLALTLGVLAGLLTFVEYVGALLSAIPPVLLAFTIGPGTAIGVLVVYTVLHVVEGYVLTPLLARASVRFPPAFTLSGQILLATLVGPLGLTFSTPLLVVVAVAIREWRSGAAQG